MAEPREMFYQLAERAYALEQSGRRIMRLHIGDTNLPVPECAVAAAQTALARRRSGYGPAAGLELLRSRIARRERCGAENVVVGPGSKHLLYALLSALGSPGAKVAIATPHYPAYELAATRLGMRPVRVPTSMETSWRLDPSAIGEAKILLLCNPSNPTSTVLPPADVRRILEQARQRGTVAILDEAYRGLAFEEVPLYSDAIRVRSFSKEFNMEGWRLGYAVAPQDVVAKVVSVIQATTTCVPDFVQEAGAACLDREESLLTEHRRIWRERSRAAQEALRQAGFRFSEPGAAMYLFATHPRLTDSGAFALKLLERGIAVAPGTGFGDFPSFIRLCVNQEATVLRQAVAEMAALLQG